MPVSQPERRAPESGALASATQSVVLFGELLADLFPDRRVVGGAPFNVACHLRGLGLFPRLVSRIGRDEGAEFLLQAMRRCRLDTALIQMDDQRGSGRVDVIAEGDGHRFEIAPDQAFDFIAAVELADAAARLLAGSGGPRLIYFGTLAQRNAISRQALQTLLASYPAPRFVDLNLRAPWVSREVCESSLSQADLVKLSEDELRSVARWLPGEDRDPSRFELGRRIAAHFGIGSLFVTCGARGAWCVRGDEVLAMPAAQSPTAGGDTVGAGDAFSAVLIAGTIAAWPLPLTLERASRFAAAICGIRGATPGDMAFYQPFLEDWKHR